MTLAKWFAPRDGNAPGAGAPAAAARSPAPGPGTTAPLAPAAASLTRAEPTLPRHRGALRTELRVTDIVALIDARDDHLLHILHSEQQRRSAVLRHFVNELRKRNYRIDPTTYSVPITTLQQFQEEERPAEPAKFLPATPKTQPEAPELRMFIDLMSAAIRYGASDVRLSVQHGGGMDRTLVSMRINGQIRSTPVKMSAAQGEKMIGSAYATFIAAGSGNVELWSGEQRQEGFMSIPAARDLRLRYNLIPMADGASGAKGPDVSLRLLGWKGRSMRFRSPLEAGFSADQAEDLAAAAESPRGLMLIVGPTGSGKSTLLATLLGQHPDVLAGSINSFTIEDPPEIDVPGVRAVPIKRANKDRGSGKSDDDAFVGAMRDLLRHDPDICVPGEIRDAVSCGLVSQMTYSHKVMCTFHASDFISTLLRLCSKEIAYPPSSLGAAPLAGGLVAVASVLLLPRLCPNCSRPASSDDEIRPGDERALREHYGLALSALRVAGGGCEHCKHDPCGFMGRTSIGEIVTPDREISALIRREDFHGAYRRYRSFSDGRLDSPVMRGKTLFEHALSKALAGHVSIVDVIKLVDSPAMQAAMDERRPTAHSGAHA